MKFYKKTFVYCSLEEINKHLKYCSQFKAIKFGRREERDNPLFANIEDKVTRFMLTYRKGLNKPITYIFMKDGSERSSKLDPLVAYSTMMRYEKIPSLKYDARFGYKEYMTKDGKVNVEWFVPNIGQYIYENPNINGQRVKAWSYDVNSSFSASLLKPLPDVTQVRFLSRVGENEVGFDKNDANPHVEDGHIHTYVFPLKIFPGLVKFANVYFERKAKAKDDPEKRQYCKDMMNMAIGFLARHNPFVRNMIVYYSNTFIKNLIDEDTLYSNTDSLVSMSPRNDIIISEGLGDFKLEHKNEWFAYKDSNYQWGKSFPTYRGISPEWFKRYKKVYGRSWDLLEDGLPSSDMNYYEFDLETCQMKRKAVKYAKEKEEKD